MHLSKLPTCITCMPPPPGVAHFWAEDTTVRQFLHQALVPLLGPVDAPGTTLWRGGRTLKRWAVLRTLSGSRRKSYGCEQSRSRSVEVNWAGEGAVELVFLRGGKKIMELERELWSLKGGTCMPRTREKQMQRNWYTQVLQKPYRLYSFLLVLPLL